MAHLSKLGLGTRRGDAIAERTPRVWEITGPPSDAADIAGGRHIDVCTNAAVNSDLSCFLYSGHICTAGPMQWRNYGYQRPAAETSSPSAPYHLDTPLAFVSWSPCVSSLVNIPSAATYISPPPIYTPDTLRAATLPIYPGLGQASNNAGLHTQWFGWSVKHTDRNAHTHTHTEHATVAEIGHIYAIHGL